MQPRHFLIEIAQQPHCFRLILYLVDKEQSALVFVDNYFLLQTQILEYLSHIIGYAECFGIGTLFEIQLYIAVVLFAEFINESGLAHLACPAQNERFAVSASAPFCQIFN